MTPRQLAILFFTRRFGPLAHHASSYFEEWVDRFESGHPETFMDPHSLQVWHDIRAALFALREEMVA